jgi:hypothetical protein
MKALAAESRSSGMMPRYMSCFLYSIGQGNNQFRVHSNMIQL